MELSDLTMANPKVGQYFQNKKGDYVPVMEFIYIHEHPFMQPNFVTEIKDVLARAASIIKSNEVDPAIMEKYKDLMIRMVKELPELTAVNAWKVLEALRELYLLSAAIVKQYSDK